MTWEELRVLLNNHHSVNHTSMDKPVVGIIGGEPIELDIYESLTSGETYLIEAMTEVTDDQG